MRASANIFVNKPQQDVWSFISNIENYGKWAPQATDIKQTSEGEFGLGSTFTLKYAFRGKTYDISGKVTAFDPIGHLGMNNVGGPFPMDETIDLEPSGRGTRVTHVVDVKPSGIMALVMAVFGPLMRPMFKKEITTDLRSLKAYVEGQ